MSTNLRFWAALLILCLISTLPLAAQEASTDSVRLSQPIPVTIRMTNNNIVKGMLVGMDQNGISIMNQQGRTVDFTYNKVRSFRNQDGSIFFTPAKDTAGDLIGRLNTLQPAQTGNAGGPGAANSFTGGGGHGQMPPAFTPPPPFQASAHNQSHAPTYNPPPPTIPSSSHSHSSYTPPPNPYTPPASHSSHTPHTPYSPPPMHNPMHNQMPPPPSMPQMGQGPMNNQMQMVWEYTCTNCRHKFESATEVKAGHRCAKCGVVWGEIQDQSGRTISSSPAAKVGSGIGGLALIIGIIVAIVRKAQSN